MALVASLQTAVHGRQTNADGAVFRSGVELVTLHVTVRDQSRQYVGGLNHHQFRVFEDGRPQELKFFQRSGLPLALTLLLDTSSSVTHALPTFQQAALEFIRELAPDDVASVVTFGEAVRVAQGFTSEQAALATAIRSARAGGGTALFNGIYIALNELRAAGPSPVTHLPRRHTIVLLSDGDDNTSAVGFDNVLDLASRTNAAIYTVRLGRRSSENRQWHEGAFVLRKLAYATGGRAFFPAHGYEVRQVLTDIRAELSSQYALAYEPDSRRDDRRFHTLTVLVEQPGAVARTRPGYFGRAR